MAEIDPELAAALQAALDVSRTHIIDLGSLGQLDTDTERVTPIGLGDIAGTAEHITVHPTYAELSDPETGQRNRVGHEVDPDGRLSDALHRAFWRNDAVPGDWVGPLRGDAGPHLPMHLEMDNSGGRFIPDEYAEEVRAASAADIARAFMPAVDLEPAWQPTRGYRIRAWFGRAWWWLSGLRIVHQSRICDWCGDGD